MKKSLFFGLFVCLFACFIIVSCGHDVEEQLVDGLSVYESLSTDSKIIIDKIGEANGAYQQSSSKYVNGQVIDKTYRDKEGNPIPVCFNSWLISYKIINDLYLRLFDNIECNARLHNSHGYSIQNLSEKSTYVEYCEYRFMDNSDFNEIGDICFVEIRLICGDINSSEWYAKSLRFSPSMENEISVLSINITTGDKISYDLRSGKTETFKYSDEYNDDGILSKRTIYNEDGNVSEINEYDSNGLIAKKCSYDEFGNLSFLYEYACGFLTTETAYDDSGLKMFERIYDGTSEEKMIRRNDFDEFGEIPYWYVYEYNQAGYMSKWTQYRKGNNSKTETFYDDLSHKVTKQVFYDENGQKTGWSNHECNSDGYTTVVTHYNASEKKTFVLTYDGTSSYVIVEKIYYNENEKISRVEKFNSDGYLTSVAFYYDSGFKKSETFYDGTNESSIVSTVNWDESGNIIN